VADAYSEIAVLEAVLWKLKITTGLDENHIDIVPTPQTIPTLSRAEHILISPNGWSPRGNPHNTSGGVRSETIGVAVTVINNLGAIPEDRKWKYLFRYQAMSKMIAQVMVALDWQYDVLTKADEILLEATGSTEGFQKCLVWQNIDPTPGMIGPEFWGAASKARSPQHAGVSRTIRFSSMERTQVI